MSGRERKEGPDVLSDIEIAQATKPQHISAIAEKAGVPESYLELYGTNKAKVDYNLLTDEEHAPGKLILVTAINPTPAGEGKTTTTVGLADALARQGKNVVVALREPSLGPVFGVKGGAAGGGYAQVIPMEDINLHFTGDFHAIGAANNLLAAINVYKRQPRLREGRGVRGPRHPEQAEPRQGAGVRLSLIHI